MEPLAILLALAAAVLHATWNAMVKVNRDRYAAMTALAAFGAVSGPVLILLDATPAWEAWPYLLTSVVLHIGYNTFLILAYRVADFSHAQMDRLCLDIWYRGFDVTLDALAARMGRSD